MNGTLLQLHNPANYHGSQDFNNITSLASHFVNGEGRNSSSCSYRPTKEEEENKVATALNTYASIQNAIHDCINPQKLYFIESNSAHHLSYFIALKHLPTSNEHGRSIVVNFDQHSDYGGKNSRFFCGSWGYFIQKERKCDYLVIGIPNTHGMQKYEFHKYDGADVLTLDPPPSLPANKLPECNELNKVLNRYNQIYVTVDMDVLGGIKGDDKIKRTNWRHGAMSLEKLVSLLNALPQNKVVAADIAGFPPQIEKSGDDTIREYLAEIKCIASILSKKIIR